MISFDVGKQTESVVSRVASDIGNGIDECVKNSLQNFKKEIEKAVLDSILDFIKDELVISAHVNIDGSLVMNVSDCDGEFGTLLKFSVSDLCDYTNISELQQLSSELEAASARAKEIYEHESRIVMPNT